MDPAGIRTTYLVLYASHFKPQGRVRCGKKKQSRAQLSKNQVLDSLPSQKSKNQVLRPKPGEIRKFSSFITSAEHLTYSAVFAGTTQTELRIFASSSQFDR